MQIQLCKKSIERLGPDMPTLLATLRDRQHTPVIKDCLNRCQACDFGMLIANADGMPLRAKNVDKLLDDLDALAQDS